MGGRSPLLRTLLPRSDTAARISFNGRSATRSCERSTSPRASVNCILRAPGRPVDLERDALREARDSTRSRARSRPLPGNSRVPWPTTTEQTSKVISSTNSLSRSQRTSVPLPCTTSATNTSPPSRHRRPDLCPGLSGTSAVLDSTAQRCRARPGVGNGLRRRESNREDSDRPFNAQCGPVGAEIGVQLEDSRALVRPDRRPASTRPSRCAAHSGGHPS